MAHYLKGKRCIGCKAQEYRTPSKVVKYGIDQSGYCADCRTRGIAVADPNLPVVGQQSLF